jgi:hypothetical protein
MPQATRGPVCTKPIPLSSLFADPVIREAFSRAEQDQGKAFAVPARRPVITAANGPTQGRTPVPTRLRDQPDLPTAVPVLLFAASLLLLVLIMFASGRL